MATICLFQGHLKQADGVSGTTRASPQLAGPDRHQRSSAPAFGGDFCTEAVVAGAPQRCQPWSNPMPKSPGFMQGLNLNFGKENAERKASLIAGLVLNPSLLSRAVLAGGICGHGERRSLLHSPARWPCARWGGFQTPQIPAACLRRELGGHGCQRWSSSCCLDGMLHPKTHGPHARGVRPSAWGWLGASPSPPRPAPHSVGPRHGSPAGAC